MGHGFSFKRSLRQAISVVGPRNCNGAFFPHRRLPPGARILCFHGIDKTPTNEYAVKASEFSAQMRYLKDCCRLVTVDQLIEASQKGQEQLSHLAAVTIDDGYQDFYRYGFPVLHDLDIPATVFLPTGLIDGDTVCRNPLPQQSFLKWEQVRELQRHGIAFGSHTVSHRSLTSLSLREIRFELRHSKSRIEDELGTVISGFSYPYGTFRDTDSRIGMLIAEAGYSWAVTAISGSDRAGANPFALRRTVITRDDGPAGFRRALQGTLDGWVMVQRIGDSRERMRNGHFERVWDEDSE